MGWKSFWSEIVIVVLGVVIALAANEAVQDWIWRSKVKDAEARLQVVRMPNRPHRFPVWDTLVADGTAAQQRMLRIADAGDAPSSGIVELFLNAAGKHPSGADYSGMAQFCTARGLPVANGRDYRKITVSIGPPGMGAHT